MGRRMSLRMAAAAVGTMVFLVNFGAWGAGIFETGEYRNYLKEMGKTDEEISAKIDAQWNRNINGVDAVADPREQLEGEHNYHEIEGDMAYVTGWNREIYSKNMGQTMLAAVQYGDQEVFNKLWKFAKTKMYQTAGAYQGYFPQKISGTYDFVGGKRNPSPRGDQNICMSLCFAANRWGNGSGIFNYQAEADNLLSHWVNNAGVPKGSGNYFLFSSTHKLPVLHHNDNSRVDIEVSGLMPHYYKLWAAWTDDAQIRSFFEAAAPAAIEIIKRCAHPLTMFTSYTATLNGTPSTGEHRVFFTESYPTIMNVALDNSWFQPEQWHNSYADGIIGFFAKDNRLTTNGGWCFERDGRNLGGFLPEDQIDKGDTPVALRSFLAMNAPHCSNEQAAKTIVDDFWDLPYLQDKFSQSSRGIEYLLALLHLSGRFKIYGPDFTAVEQIGRAHV